MVLASEYHGGTGRTLTHGLRSPGTKSAACFSPSTAQCSCAKSFVLLLLVRQLRAASMGLLRRGVSRVSLPSPRSPSVSLPLFSPFFLPCTPRISKASSVWILPLRLAPGNFSALDRVFLPIVPLDCEEVKDVTAAIAAAAVPPAGCRVCLLVKTVIFQFECESPRATPSLPPSPHRVPTGAGVASASDCAPSLRAL